MVEIVYSINTTHIMMEIYIQIKLSAIKILFKTRTILIYKNRENQWCYLKQIIRVKLEVNKKDSKI